MNDQPEIRAMLDHMYADVPDRGEGHRKGYETRCLDACVTVRGIAEAIKATTAMPIGYNEFTRAKLRAALRTLPKDPFKYRNFRFGREGSPVLYVEGVAEGDVQTVVDALAPTEPDEVFAYEQRVYCFGGTRNPEYVDADDAIAGGTGVRARSRGNDRYFELRFWWD